MTARGASGPGVAEPPPAELVEVALVGRLTPEAMADFAATLRPVLDAAVPFAVLVDRTLLRAPTADGRAAFERWWHADGEAIKQGCVAWADLYDPRRAAGLRTSDTSRAHPDRNAASYPQEVFGDRAEALTWLVRHGATTPRPSPTGQLP